MFVLLLFLSILLAWLAPSVGGGVGPFSLSAFAHWGISLIFFFYGLRLDGSRLRGGLANLRLHLVVQAASFLLFPILILIPIKLFGLVPTAVPFATVSSALWLGIFFLAALPSTVSSSVVMVNLAHGNVPAAIFNASLSSLLGVFITPLWMRLYLTSETGGSALGETFLSLVVQVIVPILLGMALNRRLGWFSQKYDRALRLFDQSVILLIVYTSFCHSFAEEMFSGLSTAALSILSVGMIALFFLVYFCVDGICRLLRFNREDTITALFCGSKKSLVHGTVMSAVLLADPKLAGLLILPTMIYHALQLVIVGILVKCKT